MRKKRIRLAVLTITTLAAGYFINALAVPPLIKQYALIPLIACVLIMILFGDDQENKQASPEALLNSPSPVATYSVPQKSSSKVTLQWLHTYLVKIVLYVYAALMVVIIAYSFFYLATFQPSPIAMDRTSGEFKLIQGYCQALQQQDYHQISQSFGVPLSLAHKDMTDKSEQAYSEQAQSIDRSLGKVTECLPTQEKFAGASPSGTGSGPVPLPIAGGTKSYIFDVKVARSDHKTYTTHIKIESSQPYDPGKITLSIIEIDTL